MATVLVIGGGITGPVLALFLQQKGFKPIIFEKVQQTSDIGGAIILAANGNRALSLVGLQQRVAEKGFIVKEEWHQKQDSTILLKNTVYDTQDTYGFPTVCINRAALLQVLHEAVLERGIPLHMGKKLVKIEDDLSKDFVKATFSDGTEYEGAFLAGCDGLNSITRVHLFGEESPAFTGTAIFAMSSKRPTEIEQIINLYGDKGEGFILCLPVSNDGLVLGTVFPVSEATDGWQVAESKLAEHFKERFANWGSPMPTLLAHARPLAQFPVYDRPPIEKWYKGRCILIGDAAHPSTPHMGQGGNQGLIDCAVLGKLIEKYRLNPTLTSLHGAFADFQAARLESTVVVTNASRLRGEHRAGLVKGDDETIRTLYGPQSEFTKLMQSLLVTEF